MFHHLGYCILHFAQSLLTMDKEMMRVTLKELDQCLDVYNKKYRKQKTPYFNKNYETFTDEEIHAELGYSALFTASALLNVVYDQSFVCFAKSAYRMTAGYIGLKEGMYILNTRKNWAHQRSREHFEAFLKICLGLFEIVIAYMPAKLSRFLDFIGFSGNFETGLEYLEESFAIKNTFGSQISGLILTVVYTLLEFFYGLGAVKLEALHRIKSDCLKLHPESSYTALVCASIHFCEAEHSEVLKICDENLERNGEQPKYVRYIFCLLKAMTYSFQCKWKDARQTMSYLLECKWSPAALHYVYGSFLFMEMKRTGNQEHEEELKIIFKKIPSLVKKIGGRKVFHDNFVVRRSQKYFQQESRKFFLPAYELFYIWNCFDVIDRDEENMTIMLKEIESLLDCGEKEFALYDDYANLLFLKATILQHSRRRDEARELFQEIINHGNKVKHDKHLLPHATFEIGRILAREKNFVEAKEWITKAKRNYSHYLTESLLHFRVEIALSRVQSDSERVIAYSRQNSRRRSSLICRQIFRL
ncbi:Tetratricopeptide repeat protein 39B-like protein [Dinothrombium tinctorium]|uniref:Tetratricopeptide repeat protein 39B-like protein n=1 Tax=Dinothrombium tinctorium TaxID=1965070 RepID=A0A3S3RZ68_9ACAR|nr:Tetratricopeptide repeat protein 39B-like protein [Dinothrombium tinctorium]